jgi:predicted GIY-YIG superfamily endonuclease
MPRKSKKVKKATSKTDVYYNPQGHHTVYILEGADGSYYAGMCKDIEKELIRANNREISHFKEPEKLPITVAFKEENLLFPEAHLKRDYLRSMNRPLRKRLIDLKVWPVSKMLEPLILEKMENYLEEKAWK